MRIGIPHLTRAVVIGTVVTVSTFAQTNPPVSTAGAAQASITARVEAIDQTTREVTLKGPLGNVVTFTVDKRVARLNEIKVGDEVTADYYVSLAAELRPPTDQEKTQPITVLKETATAPAGTEPAAGASTSWTRAGCHTGRNSTVTRRETSAAVTSTSPIST